MEGNCTSSIANIYIHEPIWIFPVCIPCAQPLQEEAEVNAQLVSRAKRMVEEQDDEIKKVNELVLHAKCNAIRDAQNAEKEEILHAMKEEEVRCKNVMEIWVLVCQSTHPFN